MKVFAMLILTLALPYLNVSNPKLTNFKVKNIQRSVASPISDCDPLFRDQDLPQKKPGKVPYETSIELELKVSKNLMRILTTEDGSLKPLFRQHDLPEWIVTKFNSKKSNKIMWDSFSLDEKFKILNALPNTLPPNFDVLVPGLRVRDSLTVNFSETNVFMGKEYPPGRHDIDVSDIFEHIEINDFYDARRNGVSGLELHFRGKVNAGEVAKSAWRLLDWVGIRRPHLHAHIPFKFKFSKKFDETVQSMRFIEYFRRINLAAEIISITTFDVDIKRTEGSDGNTLFGFLVPSHLNNILKYVESAIDGEPIGRPLSKMIAVAFKKMGFYDDPELAGLEYRDIHPKFSTEKIGDILDKVQKGLNTEEYGVPGENIETWLQDSVFDTESKTKMKFLLYTSDFDHLFENTPKEVKKTILEESNTSDFRDQIFKYSENMMQIQMIIHNWSKDPLFFNDSEAIKKIVDNQIVAVQKFLEITSDKTKEKEQVRRELKEVVIEFLFESGIRKSILSSVDF